MYVETAGNPAGPAVLMLHGALSSNLQWYPNRDALGEDFRLVMVELPGHGRSRDPDPEPVLTHADISEHLERIRSRLGIDSWHCIGHSLGAAVLLSYGLRCPDSIRSCVVTNSQSILGFGERDNGEAAQRLRDMGLRVLPFHPIHARSLAPDIKEKFVRVADRVSPGALIGLADAVEESPCRSELNAWKRPLLLFNGTREEGFQPHVSRLQSLIPKLTVTAVDCGHSPNLDRAELFNEGCIAFFGGCPGDGSCA